MAFDYNNYIEVDYIETDGSAYINTGYKPTNNTYVVGSFYSQSHSGYYYGVNSSGTQTGYYDFSHNNGRYSFRPYVSDAYVVPNQTGTFYFNDRFYLNANPRSAISLTDGVTEYSRNLNISTSGTCTRNLYLLARNNQGSVAGCVQGNRLYSMNIYNSYASGTLLYDFVPCIRKADNKVGVFDTVNETFYTSPTGAFTYGKIISDTNPFYLKVNNEWKMCDVYLKVNNEWKKTKPYLKVNNEWKETIQ